MLPWLNKIGLDSLNRDVRELTRYSLKRKFYNSFADQEAGADD